MSIYRRFERGVGTRNVLIAGTGPEAFALRNHLDSIRHLGYTFKGFIDFPARIRPRLAAFGDVVGTIQTMFQSARKEFVDEIFFTTPCERGWCRMCWSRRGRMAWTCAWFRTCTTGWRGIRPLNISASFLPFRCTAAMCRRWAWC